MRTHLTRAVLIAILSGCAASQVMVIGPTRPALPPDQVQIYLEPPKSRYEEIADLTAASGGSFKTDRSVQKRH